MFLCYLFVFGNLATKNDSSIHPSIQFHQHEECFDIMSPWNDDRTQWDWYSLSLAASHLAVGPPGCHSGSKDSLICWLG